MKTIAEIIKREREKRGWSTYDLADKSGVSQPTIHRLENKKNPNTRQVTIDRLAKVFNMSEAELRGFESAKDWDNRVSTIYPKQLESKQGEVDLRDVEKQIVDIFELARKTINNKNRPFSDNQIKNLYLLALKVGLQGQLTEEQMDAMADYILGT